MYRFEDTKLSFLIGNHLPIKKQSFPTKISKKRKVRVL